MLETNWGHRCTEVKSNQLMSNRRLCFLGEGKTGVPGENLSEQSKEQINTTFARQTY